VARGRRRFISLIVTLAFTLVSLDAARARADDYEPNVAASVLSGVAVALAPTIAGTAMIASGSSEAVRNGGLFLMQGGLTLAPFVSHAISREWTRGVVSSALPLAFTIAMGIVINWYPDLATDGSKDTRWPYVVLLAGTMLTSAGGIIDSALAKERAKKRNKKNRFAIAPVVGGVMNGIMIGGTL